MATPNKVNLFTPAQERQIMVLAHEVAQRLINNCGARFAGQEEKATIPNQNRVDALLLELEQSLPQEDR